MQSETGTSFVRIARWPSALRAFTACRPGGGAESAGAHRGVRPRRTQSGGEEEAISTNGAATVGRSGRGQSRRRVGPDRG